jgi:hypothetical protein
VGLADKIESVLFDSRDGGMRSRKFLLAVYSMHLIFGAGLIAARWTSFAPNLPTVTGGILGALGLYYGVDLGHKLNVASVAKAASAAESSSGEQQPREG